MSNEKVETLDNQIFTADAWRPDQGLNAQYKDVTLKIQVGEFPVGSKFPFAILLGDASMLVLVDEAHKEHGFRLALNVGESVDLSELQCQDENCTHHHG